MRKKTYNTLTTVGVMGTGSGVGTTHFVLELAAFLTAVKGERVAVVGVSSDECLRQAERVRDSLCHHSIPLKNMFSIYGQIPEETYTDMLSLTGEEAYSYILADCGSFKDHERNSYGHRIFRFSSRKFVVTNLCWWKLAECVEFLEQGDGLGRNWEMIANDAAPQAIRFLKQEYGQKVQEMPYEADPFCLKDQSLDFMMQLTQNR